VQGKEALMTRKIASVSPFLLAGATLAKIAGMALTQYFVGLNLIDLWRHWLLRLVIGG
jgi:hypothetical protein